MSLQLKHLCLLAFVLTILGGCAAGSVGSGNAMSPEHVERLVIKALTDIQDIYWKPTEAKALVAAGLSRVDKDNPGIAFRIENDDFITSYQEVVVSRFSTNDEHLKSSNWGEQAAKALVELERADNSESGPNLESLTSSFLRGIADSLDAYTRYHSFDESRLARELHAGQLGTINARLRSGDRGILVDFVADQESVGASRLQAGDLITAIDGYATAEVNLFSSHTLLIGPVSSVVALTVTRGGTNDESTILLRRQKIHQLTFSSKEIDGLLHLSAGGLNRKTVSQVRISVSKSKPSLESIVLDLRGNPGGVLDAIVEMGDLFMKGGGLFSTQGRHSNSFQYFSAKPGDITGGVPLVILVDGNTGSGSEILAASLQDSGRAIVVGQTSFGLGTIQTVLRLHNRGELAITWTEVQTNGGYWLNNRGVLPTVCTGSDKTVSTILTALRAGDGILDRSTRTQWIDPKDEAALAAHRALCPPRSDGEDISLEVAKAILEEPGLYERILKLDQGSQAAALH